MSVSLIVTTSPGREDNLAGCLQLLTRQTRPPDQVIVADDGSARGRAVAATYADTLPLDYLWRPNDCRVALSRNLGAEAASGRWLIFIDSDMLLNPHGIASYLNYLEEFPDQALYGYFGYQGDTFADSVLLPGRQVKWIDHRFEEYQPEGLRPALNMIRYPHEWAWSGNFALARARYWQIGGFDPRYRGWGGEDLDFASRWIAAGLELHFFLDAWAEQQLHTYTEIFHLLPEAEREVRYASHYDSPGYTPRVLYSAAGWARLRAAIGQYLRADQN